MPPGISALRDLACLDSRHCLAVGAGSTAPPTGDPLLTTDDAGKTWTAHKGLGPGEELSQPACNNSLDCTLVEHAPTTALLVSTDAGSTWAAEALLPSNLTVSCLDLEHCLGTEGGFRYSYQPLLQLFASGDGWSTWISRPIPPVAAQAGTPR